MLIKKQYQVASQQFKPSEAFAATCIQFSVKLTEVQMASGLTKQAVEGFQLGSNDLTTKDLWKILNSLTPQERTFYNSMISIQEAAESAGIILPLLDLQAAHSSPDPIRGALELTMQVFNIQSKTICTRAGMASSNFANWLTGARGNITILSLEKIKRGLTCEQRIFMDAIVNALATMNSEKQVEVRQLPSVA